MHWNVGRDDRQSARHRLYQRVRKRLRVCGSNVKIRTSVDLMQLLIRDGTEFDHHIRNSELLY